MQYPFSRRQTNTRHIGNLLSYVVSLVVFFVTANTFAQDDIHQRWAANVESQPFEVDHQPLNQILAYITAESSSQDQYSFFKLQGPALKFVKDYRAYLENVPVSKLNKNEQLAYWLNLHNVLVIEKYATNLKQAKRLKKKKGTPDNAGAWWSEKLATVEGIGLSLNDIETNILARHWDEPLFLYGLFYGVRGQGFSGTQSFTGKKVQSQLAKLAAKFIDSDRNIDVKKSEIAVSSLLAWHKAKLFDNSDENLIKHLQDYAQGDKASQLAAVTSVNQKHKFDWKSLNQRPPRQTRPVNGAGASAGSAGPVYRGGS
ncbi:DUF547 domain-containing protein [Agaribacter flavus]|uniref:DUF547 domain-containing protein n=1 Tax=Agaribacter flavus TaxID=1902781 RepID=A0ABV7FUR4_9ALTE